jgi:hypothetical protein
MHFVRQMSGDFPQACKCVLGTGMRGEHFESAQCPITGALPGCVALR